MRLHRLTIEAFGPFAAEVGVDFDELSGAGLFLLSGPTGAGKTSVLDAVCFALYGDVPGDRNAAKRLRCDQAPPGAVPRVELEATLSGRRFRFVRSPAWERPKKRGTGTTTEPARVTVSELVEGSWLPLSSRLDETGDLVGRVVGLTMTQFTQVAMLPQGRFQAFLRARSDERHRLLQQLFRTGRFEAVERWLVERRQRLGRDDARHHELVADVVSRAAETAATPLPDAVDLHDLRPTADDGSLRAWLEQTRAASVRAHSAAEAALTAATAAEVHSREALATARTEVDRRRRLDGARRELAVLQAGAATHDDDARRLDEARRAAGVLPWARLARAADARAASARDRAGAAARALRAHRPDLDDDPDLTALAAGCADAAASARALRPRAERLVVVDGEVATLERRRHHLAAQLAELTRVHAERPAEVDRLRTLVLEVRDQAAGVETLTVLSQESRHRLDALEEATTIASRREAARERWLAAREAALSCKDTLLTVQLARVDGMAAELAGALAVGGGSCPVCGSAEHPSLAHPAPGAPDAASEREARKQLGDAEVLEHALDQQVRDLERALAAATARAGHDDPATLVARLATHQEQLADALRAAGRLPELEARLESQVAELDQLGTRLATLTADASAADVAHQRAAAEAEALRDELAALGTTDLAGLDAVAAAHRRTTELCADALRAADDATEAAWSAEQAHRALDDAAAEAGFEAEVEGPDAAATALAAALDPEALARLDDAVTHHRHRVAAVTEVLRESDPDDVGPLPDLDAHRAAHEAAVASARVASADAALHAARATRLAGLLDELDDALAAWAPLRHDLDLATRLAAFVEGRSTDNLLRMRLSAFVLAYRLGQVVGAANERLAGMSDQRYSLEHTGRRGAGETRGGLSLLVRDDWSGESRDPATLSGGETFVVSLALALGLADVIAHEAGGASLDTLFVDEGFGSLDAETLDDVMDTLDALRDGGRVVGVVSHVAEMRDRIPTQLVVTKSRQGSSLALRR